MVCLVAKGVMVWEFWMLRRCLSRSECRQKECGVVWWQEFSNGIHYCAGNCNFGSRKEELGLRWKANGNFVQRRWTYTSGSLASWVLDIVVLATCRGFRCKNCNFQMRYFSHVCIFMELMIILPLEGWALQCCSACSDILWYKFQWGTTLRLLFRAWWICIWEQSFNILASYVVVT